jgi:hypothetical protein
MGTSKENLVGISVHMGPVRHPPHLKAPFTGVRRLPDPQQPQWPKEQEVVLGVPYAREDRSCWYTASTWSHSHILT